jgi:predicted nuclease with TOPRIM domain
MASDELKIVLEDVKEKFDTVIEGINMVRETLERHEYKNDEQFKKIDMEFLGMRKDIRELREDVNGLRQDLNDHRDNTELHAGGRRKEA